ncbi:hypothetical protein GPECTOR_9g707 [Gonium pectorale]|uniref:SET domain-containing protein n=1 Tax=Gonium pectorale TaxID=33097 RepID=A0A150GSG9_GONPE|nr:hypothetical protein GPECTOR_9g707 [Gonium pectorale]|eukprot:KXZ52662.1 hypothetical protein GPECTOR_9g707 [Gonium pectorale]
MSATCPSAALDKWVAQRLAEAEPGSGLYKSLPVPRTGAAATDVPGGLSPEQRPRGVLPLPLAERRVGVRMAPAAAAAAGGAASAAATVRTRVRSIPAVQQPPAYTTWSYLRRNELAQDHGRRMFLVDEAGETVPADDGETEERLPWEDVDGPAVDWAITRLAQEQGWDNPDVLEALMDVLRPQPMPEAIAQRLAYLYGLTLEDEDRDRMDVEEMLDAFEGSFCRRCRNYGCRTHSGGHVKPNHRPAQPPPDTGPTPCGPGCWKGACSGGGAAAGAADGGGGGVRGGGAGAGGSGGGTDRRVAAAPAGAWREEGGRPTGQPLATAAALDPMDVDGDEAPPPLPEMTGLAEPEDAGAGWGVFAAQHVGKNGFLGEYTGDLITQDEANRRGSVYDHMNNSYLFNLNKEWVVDAKFRGNKLRCANHSHEPVAAAKVLLVDGESRIAIFADKAVAPGMEITYDYRYSDDTAPQWVKKKQQRG